MSRPTIGIAAIMKNEADNLKKFTRSLGKSFDQMIMIDTGSVDGSAALAKKLGWEVHHFTWIDDFSAARNFAFSKLTTEYGMWADLDDLLMTSESFISWRDTLMNTADLWFANYSYAQDAKGNPTCSHARERVVRLSKDFEWRYPIHEGLILKNPHTKIQAQFCVSWHIKHDRTAEDLARDRSRNIEIFEKNEKEGKLDSRLLWYFAKELFETGNHVAAIPKFLKAISDKKLEMHDRILALQYLSESYLRANQPEQAIAMAHQGLQLDPNRAEMWCQIGNCYVMKNDFIKAIPFYSAAKKCQMSGNPAKNQTGALFVTETYYKEFPRIQLAKCFSQLQRWDDAYNEAKEAVDLYADPESKVILGEVIRIKDTAIEVKDGPRTKLNEIVFTIPPQIPYEFDPDLKRERGLGGSETALIEMAKELKKETGLPVKVFTPRTRRAEMTRDGVEYLSIMQAKEYFATSEPSLHIAWRHNLPVTRARTLVWNHDLASVALDQIDRYEKALALSPFHKAFLVSMLGIPPEKIHVTRNGLAPSDIEEFDVDKDPNKVIFSSSPDRGLDRAIKVVEMAREVLPDLKLHVFYGFDLLRIANPNEADRLERLAFARPWVIQHGNVKKTELMKHFAESAVWLYPTNFLETSCITAMEALVYGAYPIVRSYGALQDTLKGAAETGHASMIDNYAETDEELQVFADELVKVVKERKYELPAAGVLAANHWNLVAKEWVRDFGITAALEKLEKAV